MKTYSFGNLQKVTQFSLKLENFVTRTLIKLSFSAYFEITDPLFNSKIIEICVKWPRIRKIRQIKLTSENKTKKLTSWEDQAKEEKSHRNPKGAHEI